MKKIVMGILVVCFCLINTTAFAGQPYFSVNVGAFLPTNSDLSNPLIASGEVEYDKGIALSYALGQDLDIVRIEAEVSYKAADIDKGSVTLTNGASGSGPIGGDIRSLSLMGNVWKDIKTNGIFTPYVGMGLGIAELDVEIEDAGESDIVFAYELGFGVGIALQKHLSLDFSYRYFATSNPDFDGIKAEFASNNVMVGIRMNM